MKLDTSDFIQRAIYLTGDWSPEIGGLFAGLRPGDLFVDIGANVGFFSLLAASKGAEVIAFEPNQACVAALVDNLTLNDFDNVQIRSVALGNTSGRGTLSVVDGKNLGSGSIEFATSSSAEIEVDTLDAQLAGRRPSLIKIDVEGAEFLVLQGALETLRMSPAPKVVLEISEYSLTK